MTQWTWLKHLSCWVIEQAPFSPVEVDCQGGALTGSPPLNTDCCPETGKNRQTRPRCLNCTNQFASSEQRGEDLPEASDALQLDDKEQSHVHHTLHAEGHEESAHTRLRHGEVVFLIRYVWNNRNMSNFMFFKCKNNYLSDRLDRTIRFNATEELMEVLLYTYYKICTQLLWSNWWGRMRGIGSSGRTD